MKKTWPILMLIICQAQAQTSQKIWKQFICNNTSYRVLRISYKDSASTDSVFIQQKINNKWVADASYFMPSEGAKYEDVNADGYIDISLQMRFGRFVFVYNAKQKKYVPMGEVGYDGFEKIAGEKNVWYTFIQYKKTHEWWAQVFTIVNGKKVLLHELEASPYQLEGNDDLYDTKYESITYKIYDNNGFEVKETFEKQDAENFFSNRADEQLQCKKWLTNKYKLARKKKAV